MIYAKGQVLPNVQYGLKGTPCGNVMEGAFCCYPEQVRQQFPEDKLLLEMDVESYAGLPLLDSSGRVVGLIAAMDGKPMLNMAEVTSLLQLVATRAAAELEREQSERLLQESRQFLDRVIETIADPVFVKDSEHRWVRLNQAFCDFVGQPMAALLGKRDSDFFSAHEAAVFRIKDKAVFASGEEDVSEETFTDCRVKPILSSSRKPAATTNAGNNSWWGPSWTSPSANDTSKNWPACTMPSITLRKRFT
ncbi:PAS domain-containing protein [Methylomonas koyamae]|uniref:PAS domain-containing protein n=1 Tax=Methylomonas koyamae TaxID=702114 RepID=UPI00155DD814|nr:PAS domain-containing protein [Methylomonas koyamae]